jgi:ligand-binding sensor domain-containing protein/putative methionine-R-sulfoxide reductase with GAF domain/two-component sensor histidine kinase
LQEALKQIVFTVIALVTGACTSFCQLPDYSVKMLTEQQGIVNGEITGVVKDKQNFLWLTSADKVIRYDGKQSWTFPVDGVIQQLCIDSKNRKWLLTRDEVQLFINDYKGFNKLPRNNGTGDNPVALFEISNILYLLLSTGLQQYDEELMSFVKSKKSIPLTSKRISNIYAQNGAFLFFTAADSLYSFNFNTLQLEAIECKRVERLTALTGNAVLVTGNTAQTTYVHFSNREKKLIDPGRVDKTGKTKFFRVYNGICLKDNIYLLASNMGLMEYHLLSQSFHPVIFYYQGNTFNNLQSVRNLYKDNDGTVYMTHIDGLAYYKPFLYGIRYLKYYTYNNISIPDPDIRGFTSDDKGNIWVASANGFFSMNMSSGVLQNYISGIDKNNINSPTMRFLVYYNNYLWVGTGYNGVWLYQPSINRFSRPLYSNDSLGAEIKKTYESEYIWKILPLANGHVFITGGNYCYVVNKNTLLVTRLSKSVFTGISRSAVQDASGRIWRGTSNGLNCTDEQFMLLFNIRDSFPDKRVAAFCEWKKNHMFIGTKGLYEAVSSGGTIQSFKRIEAIPAQRFIYCMEKDKLGRVWMGTDDGLYCYNPVTKKVMHFNTTDNVQPLAFNSNGLYLANEHLMFAGGKAGMNYFDPLLLQKPVSKLQPVVTTFSVHNNDSVFFMQRQPYRVDYFQRGISITISAPDYEKPFQLRYRYKLREKDQWIANGNSRFVRLNSLAPGNYNFTASVSHDGTNWFDAAVPVSFTVLQPWWRQWWFITLSFAGACGLLFLLYIYRQKQKRRKQYQRTIDYFTHSGFEHSTVDDILWDIARNCISGLGFQDCVIYLVDEQRKVLVQKAAYGPKSPRHFEIINRIEIPVGKGITGAVAQSGAAEIIADTSKDKRYVVDDEQRFSELAVPIIHQQKVIGVIDSEHKQKNFFTKDHLETLKAIASVCSAKISRGMAVTEMKKAEQQLAELNARMLETKFMNLRLQMNPHFLFNSLSSIQHLVVSRQTNEAYNYLSVFSAFLRSVLQYADKTVIKLDEELKMLDLYIRLESLGSDKTFQYKIKVDEQLEPEDILIPPLIIQPVVENAIWHGLMHKEGERNLEITFTGKDDAYMLCTVKDNGIGRSSAAVIAEKKINSFAYQSKSTLLIKERLQLLEKKTGKPAGIKTEDITVDDKPAGTLVQLIIPFYNIDEV